MAAVLIWPSLTDAAAAIELVGERADNDATGKGAPLRLFRAGLEFLALRHWRHKWDLGGEELEHSVKEDFRQLKYRHRWPLTFDTAARFVPRYPSLNPHCRV